MSKKKYLKIDPSKFLDFTAGQTVIRPKSITINLENRGKDFKLEYKEVYVNKTPPEEQEWTIEFLIETLNQIQEEMTRSRRYFYYQLKPIKRGYQLMIVSDDAFALIVGVLSELMVFGIRNKEDSHNLRPMVDSILKSISRANLIDEQKG